MSKCFLVIGPPRTGTSLTMGILSAMGVYTGNDYRVGPNNPCYYEDKTLFQFIKGKATAEEVVNKLDIKPIWGMKHPTITYRWKEFEPLIENPYFIVTTRDFSAQAKSFRKAISNRPNQPDQEIIDRNQKHYGMCGEIGKTYPMLTVSFEKWFSDSENQLRKVSEFIGLPVTNKARELINPELRSDND